MLLDIPYRGYHKALEQNLRRAAEEEYHTHRNAVDAKVHPGYGNEIVNAALSPDGRGLANYGEVTLRIGDRFIAHRASILRENAYAFYERYSLGRRDAVEEPGWRAVWDDRVRLGGAHLAPALTPATAEADFPGIILSVGSNRDEDKYLEVHIYGGINSSALEGVTLERALTDIENRGEWDLARQKLGRLAIPVQNLTDAQ